MQKLNLSDAPELERKTSVDSAVLVADNSDSESDDGDYAIEIPTLKKKTSLETEPMKKAQKKFLVFACIAILLGVVTGFSGYQLTAKTSSKSSQAELPTVVEGKIKAGDVFGSNDESFKDTATGYLEVGGFDGEGSHKLLREGGESQTVYLTSSVTDLSEFEGMEVEIWGETFQGQNVGWLMDVGRVKVLDTQGEAPTE
ncbi:MAG: hypothetical protein H6773_02115 [Pseudomonadales bacterium]|nr:hypothetical protein [Pseudomonadales bacterium]